jgi:hypothetical protein
MQPPSRPALAGFLAYGLLSWTLGEVWPLSRFPMYAHLPREGAVPVLIVEGEEVRPEELVDFHGCSAAQVRIPSGVPHRVGWRLDEIGRWVTAHTAHTATQPGELEVSFGYRVLRITPEGPRLDEQVVELCRGTARRPR